MIGGIVTRFKRNKDGKGTRIEAADPGYKLMYHPYHNIIHSI